MCQYINEKFEDWDPEDSDDIDEEWEKFPKIIMPIILSNSWLFTTLLETSNPQKPGDGLEILNYLLGNFIRSATV